MNYIKKLDEKIIDKLRCPFCKNHIKRTDDKFICESCLTEFPKYQINIGSKHEHAFNFCIQYPSFCIPTEVKKWSDIQEGYEERSTYNSVSDDLEHYKKEIDSVKEIYTKEFNLTGDILDVGGHLGRLRHFLKDEDAASYISVDPYLQVFRNLDSQPNLQKAYPCISKPCNFLACYAENLPFADDSFDWVHMRSVLDHFKDPYLALKEARRVLKTGGFLFIGTSLEDKARERKKKLTRLASKANPISLLFRIKNKLKNEGIKGIKTAVNNRINKKSTNHTHMYELQYDELVELLRVTNFHVDKVHFQKIFGADCVYISAKK
ncbi:methyltransferase domain-containing protein [Patescibacteria group bacterium]